MRICIDPGHGGYDPGAEGEVSQESNITLDIGNRLKELLEGEGCLVLSTRDDDTFVSLTERVNMANEFEADLLVSIHVNAASSDKADYISTWVYKLGGEAMILADWVQRTMVHYTGWSNGGVRAGNFQVLRNTKMPAILVEMGFISNRLEEIDLGTDDTKQIFAQAIFDGIDEYCIEKAEGNHD